MHGGLTELLQGAMVAGRHADWLDWLADLIGAAVLVALISWARRRRSAAA
jgi:VanZ family protein